jgi:hypothetical protein
MSIIAILCSDIHLQHRPPAVRAAEDWYDAMRRPLLELKALQKKYDCPVICAGDVLTHWTHPQSPPELINFAIQHLPKMHAIPGQHDLPHHSLKEIRRSAFWTLVEASVIVPAWSVCRASSQLIVHGFPWGASFDKCRRENLPGMHIAAVHKYVWIEGCGKFPGAPEDGHANEVRKNLRGYDLIVSGDNHMPFSFGKIWNCGSLMRRTVSEKQHKPRVGLLHDSGKVESHYLMTEHDVFIEQEEEQMNISSEFVEELKTLVSDSIDFEGAVRKCAQTARQPVRDIMLEALGE